MAYLSRRARAAGLKRSQARTRLLVAVRQAEVRGQGSPLQLPPRHTPPGPQPGTLFPADTVPATTLGRMPPRGQSAG